jgi:hypothetical protein
MEPRSNLPTLTIKGMPEALYRRLKARAAAARRSLNSEILRCLEEATVAEPLDAVEIRTRLSRADAVRERLNVPPLTEAKLRAAKSRGRP